MKKKNKGFTLLEIIIVFLLMSLVTYLAVPSLTRFSRGIELKGTAQKIAGILRYYRAETIQKGQIHQVLFNLQNRELIVRALELEKQEEVKGNWIEKRKYQIPGTINLREEEIGPSEYPADLATIEFYPSGNSNGGQIILEEQGKIRYRIKISFFTGIIEVERI